MEKIRFCRIVRDGFHYPFGVARIKVQVAWFLLVIPACLSAGETPTKIDAYYPLLLRQRNINNEIGFAPRAITKTILDAAVKLDWLISYRKELRVTDDELVQLINRRQWLLDLPLRIMELSEEFNRHQSFLQQALSSLSDATEFGPCWEWLGVFLGWEGENAVAVREYNRQIDESLGYDFHRIPAVRVVDGVGLVLGVDFMSRVLGAIGRTRWMQRLGQKLAPNGSTRRVILRVFSFRLLAGALKAKTLNRLSPVLAERLSPGSTAALAKLRGQLKMGGKCSFWSLTALFAGFGFASNMDFYLNGIGPNSPIQSTMREMTDGANSAFAFLERQIAYFNQRLWPKYASRPLPRNVPALEKFRRGLEETR